MRRFVGVLDVSTSTNGDIDRQVKPILAVLLARRLSDRTNDRWAAQICSRIFWSAASNTSNDGKDNGYVFANLIIVKAALRSALALRQPHIKEAIDRVSKLANDGNPQAMTLMAQVLDLKEEFLDAREQFEATYKLLQSIPKNKPGTTGDRPRITWTQSSNTIEPGKSSKEDQDVLSLNVGKRMSNILRPWRIDKATAELEKDILLDIVSPADSKLKYGQFLLRMGGGESMSEDESRKLAIEMITSAALDDGHLEACLELARLEEEKENRGWTYHDCLTKLALSGHLEAAKILGDMYSLEEHEWRKVDPSVRAYVESPSKIQIDGSLPPSEFYGDLTIGDMLRRGGAKRTNRVISLTSETRGRLSGRTRYFKALDWYKYASSGGYTPAMFAGFLLAFNQRLVIEVYLFYQLVYKSGKIHEWNESAEGRRFKQMGQIPNSVGIKIWDDLILCNPLKEESSHAILEKYQADSSLRQAVQRSEMARQQAKT